MNNTKYRFLTLLLAFVMLFTTLPLNVFAASGVRTERNEITDIKTVGDKQVINLGEVQGKSSFSFFSRSARLFGATTQQAGSSSETVAQKVGINLDTLGLNLGENEFDPSALTEAGSFEVNITFKELGGKRTESRTMTFQAGETKKTETFYLPKDMGQGVVEAEIPKLKDTIALRVYVSANNTTNFNLGQDMTYKFELSQIVHPVIDLRVVDPYGQELQENIAQDLGLKLSLEDEHDFNLPANTKTFNIRNLTDFAGDDIADLNEVGANPTLSLTTALDANKSLKIGDKTYKLNKITYNAQGQEVEINGQKKKVGGYIEFATQPKIVVPTPDENGDLPKTPDGYKRLSFHAESSSNAQDGRFENGQKLKVIDVLEGTEYTDADLQKEIKGIGQPTPIINGRVDDNKKFLKWNPALPETGKVADTDYWPVYLKDGGEITPGEKLPDGVFEVKVIKDDTIAKDALYGKSYGVFQGSKLARDKFPDLEAAKGHQNPKWTTEADAPATGMVDIAKPWTKVITKATTFKATASEDAATQIGKDGLKAVDTTALQGQDLTEAFWHKGVALADNTPADKKDAFAALLKDATVTDITNPARTTVEAGDKVGTLLVTFKDGSTLEVPNQKLIVKPNTVTVEFDKAEGKENPLRDGDTTVKGKITASSNSDKFPVSLDGAVVTIKKGDTVLSRTLANADGSFVAGVKDPLVAGEEISVVVTLPESKTESAPVTETVQLNPDKLNEIIPTGNEVVKHFEGKQGVNQDKVKALKDALDAADKLVDKKGKVLDTVPVTDKGQGSLNTAYENIKKAIEALTGNAAPEVKGTTSHKEIFKGDALNLEDGITVTDADGDADIVKDGEKAFTYKVEKIGDKGAKAAVADPSKINKTAGTYEVTYTAKDKSGAEGTFVMTLLVKEPVVEIKDNFPEVIPDGYVKVEFKEGDHGKLEGTTKFLVKDGSAKTVLNAPTIKPNANYEAKKDANWDPALPDTFTGTKENNKSFTFTAQYTYIGKDVVEQKPGDKKPDVPSNFVRVEFKKGDHGVISSEETTIYWVNPKKEVTLTAPTVTPSHGYKHTGWDPEVKANTMYTEAKEFVAQYKATVVTKDPNDKDHYAKVDFAAGDQGKFEQVDGQDQVTTFWVWKGEKVSFNAPKVTANENYKFKAWNKPIQETYDADTTHTATYESTQDVSDKEVKGYNKVTFKPGEHGTLTEKSVWVKPNTLVDLTDKAPKVTPAEGYSHIGWKPALIGKFADGTEIVAQYSNPISDNPVEGWTELTFDQGDHGKFAKGAKNVKWVDPKVDLKLKDIVPAIVADTNYSLDGWKDGGNKADLETAQKFETAKTFTAAYKSNVLDKEDYDKLTPEEKKNFVQITFDQGDHGKFPKEAVKEIYVKKDVAVDLTEKAPTVIPNQGYGHSGWEPALKGTFKEATTIKAQYKEGTFDENAIKEIIVVGPTQMGYGEGEKLNLAGLKVIAKDDAGLQKTYDGLAAITKAGFKVEPADKTELKMADNGKHIVVTKGEDPNKVTGQTETTLTIHENKSAKAEDVKALNQNKVVDGKVTNDPKDTTTVTGKVKPGSTVKITDENGNDITPADGVTVKEDGTFTAEVKKQDVDKKIKVIATEPGKQPANPAEATVARDANSDGKADSDADQKTAMPTAKALNVGKDPKVTTITGKAEKGATVIAKVDGVEVGKATADAVTGEYKIEAKKDGAALAKDTEVKVTAQVAGKLESEPATATVKVDKDGNGVADNEEQFDIKKATKVEIIKNPDKMDYLVNTPEGKANFQTKGLVVKFTDDSGKSATYNAEELAKMNDVTIKPANNEEIGLTPEGKTNKMDLTVTVTGAEATDKPTAKADKQVTVKLDVDGNNIADEDEKTPEPEVYARNIGKDPKVTTVEVETEKNADVTIEYKDANGDTKKITGKADDQGKLTKEIKPKLEKGTDVKVTVKDGEKQATEKTVKVFDDEDNNRIPDDQAGVTERPAAIASNKGKTPAFTTITGKTEKGAIITVTVKVEGKEKPVTVENLKVNDDGTYTLEAKYDNKPLENGAEIFVYAQNAPKKISKPQTTTVFNDFNNDGKPDGGKVDLTDVKDIQVIAPDKMAYTEGQKLVGTGLKAVVRDNKGGIEIFDYDNATGKFKDADGKEVADITATVADKAIKDLKLTEKDHNGKAIDVTIAKGKAGKDEAKGSTNQTLEVKQLQTPTPTIEFAANQNTVGSDGKTPTGTAEQKTTVKFTVVNKPTTVYVKYAVNGEAKEESFEIKATDDATKIVDLQVKLPVGAEVQVLAKDADKTLSEPAKATVVRDADNNGTADDKTPVGKTAIDPIKAQSEKITVKPADNATELVIRETDKSGNTPKDSKEITVKKDKDGNWKIGDTPVEKDEETGKLTIPTKDKLKLDEYNVVEVDAKGDPDTTTPSNARETVGQAADTKAPAKPDVDQPVDGDKVIKVKTPTDQDAKTITVAVKEPPVPGEDPKPKTVVVTKDNDGKWKTPDGKEVPEENGKLVIPVDPAVKKGDTVTVEVKDESGNGSKSDPIEVVAREQLPAPSIEPIKTGGKTVAGKAEKAATVDIYKKNAQGGYDLIKGDVGVSADGSYTYNDNDGFKNGDVIRVVAKKPGMTSSNAEATVGVDTSALDKAITDGKGELEKRNEGTPADKALEDAIKEGEELKKKDPAATQDEVNAAKDKIEKAIEEKKKTDDALDELKKAKEELDKTIKDAEDDEKPAEAIDNGYDASDAAKKVIDNKGEGKTADQIKELVEKTKEENRLLRLPVIQVAINTAINDGNSIVFTTNPGRCKVTITIIRSDRSQETYNLETGPEGTGSKTLEKALKSGDRVKVNATRITEDRPDPDYLDNYTSKRI